MLLWISVSPFGIRKKTHNPGVDYDIDQYANVEEFFVRACVLDMF